MWVDPLDGTKEYTLGNVENVTTLIGRCCNAMLYYTVMDYFIDIDIGVAKIDKTIHLSLY